MRLYSLIPASAYCGLLPPEFLTQVKRGHMATPNGACRWDEDSLLDWTTDHLRTPIKQVCNGHDGVILNRAEVMTLTGFTGKEIERQTIAGTFPKQVKSDGWRQSDLEAWFLGFGSK